MSNYFNISNYILNLILPKCNLVYGESIASIYFQIALHVNNEKNCKEWQRNSSWIQKNKISENTGYNSRVINDKFKILQFLQLIDITNKHKLKVFKLRNHNLEQLDDIVQFNKVINSILKAQVSEDVYMKINQLDNLYLREDKILGKFTISNINALRSKLMEVEKIHKGSSLFFINCILQDIFKKEFELLSEEEKAIRIGSSQSTVSRYIKKYHEMEIINVQHNKNNKPYILNCLSDVSNMQNTIMKVNNTMEKICPICKVEFDNNDKLISHVFNTKDEKHIVLKHFKNRKENKQKLLDEIFYEYKEDFEELSEDKIEKNLITDEELTNNRKSVEVKEEKSNKKVKENSSPSLVGYFYSLSGSTSPNFVKECAQVKALLKKNYSPEEIKVTMRFLSRKGSIDLRFLNNSIEEALLENRYLQQVDTQGTEPFLVKLYYTGLKQNINMQTFIKDVSKIKETLNNGYSYEQVQRVIEHMIKINCPTINFIGSKINEALQVSTKVNQNANPCLYEDDSRELEIIKSNLKEGSKKIESVKESIKFKVIDIARSVFLNNEFNTQKYDNFEWAFKVGLDLDEELYSFGLKNQKTKSIFEKIISNPNTSLENKEKAQLMQKKYENWLINFNIVNCVNKNI